MEVHIRELGAGTVKQSTGRMVHRVGVEEHSALIRYQN